MFSLLYNSTVPVTCKYGYNPYIDNTTNALNPCFVSLVSTATTTFFIIVGLWQLVNLYLNAEVPRSFNRNIKNFQCLPARHISHLTSILFQATLYCIQFIYVIKNTSQSYPPILKYSILSNLCFTILISLPTQYIQYFKSICAVGNQLFFYLVQILFLSFQLLQRYYHSPDDSYNLIQGNIGMIIEILLMLNVTQIFVYDLIVFKPSHTIINYYDENNIFHSVNIFSNLTYMWMNKLISETYANKKLKDPNHLPLPPIDLNIRDFTVSVEKNWEYQRLQNKNSLLNAIWKTLF